MPSRPSITLAKHLILLAAVTAFATAAEAQRPFSTLDPFYQEESARRAFFDGFAVQADVAYRGTEPGVHAGARLTPVALSVRLDYALAQQVDVSAVIDASGGFDGAANAAPLRLSWLIAKPYWRHGNTDYAVRLAVDPARDGGFGFRQTDLAFLSSSNLTPTLSTDFAIGLRRANVGFEHVTLGGDLIAVSHVDSSPEIVRSRAAGTEVHLMWGYRFWLNPSGSHIFTTLSGQGMAYETISTRPPPEASARPAAEPSGEPVEEGRLLGGVGRLNIGAEYTRPSFIIAPYVSLPLFRWIDVEAESRMWGPRVGHAQAGLRVTVR